MDEEFEKLEASARDEPLKKPKLTRILRQRAYCPPLDPALFSAILSDYDLSDPRAVREAQATLDSLKASALEADTTDFDPSGTTGLGDVRPHDPSSPEDNTLFSEGTTVTSLSNGLSSLSVGEDEGGLGEYMDSVEQSDDATKLKELKNMFPETSEYNISFTLVKCKGDFCRAMDELLNQCFIDGGALDEEHATSSKSVDAFSEDSIGRRSRRKTKNKKLRNLDAGKPGSPLMSPSTPPASPWQSGANDVEFICVRTKLASTKVSSLYHKNGGTLAGTIRALLEDTSLGATPSDTEQDGEALRANMADLGKDFPGLHEDQLIKLLSLTAPSTAAAHELAKAMTIRPQQGRIEVIPRYAPIEVDEDGNEKSWTTVTPAKRAAALAKAGPSGDAAALASTYAAASSRAYTQAGAAYRRGKSDHLMGAAAGYYSQVGRELAMKSKEATAEAADELVARQSSANHVDLHGVSVKDAVRIARQRTEAWWRVRKRRAVGVDGRVRDEADGDESRSNLTIVTGMGHHSRGGKGLIGPAVGRMLMQEGYEVRAGEGNVTVVGKR